ncbi:MAG: hypothetical protein DRN27_06205 [Thermoplasmata archaeon]|nr:MAG: hypothetical protein DRN27_06205 [Thermoplasmata archaeon]
MKITIKELEEKLGYKIKTNFTGAGLDTASRTGFCYIKTNATFAEFDWCFLEFNYNSQKEMLKQMHCEFKSLFTDEDTVVVEEVFIGFNRMGCLRLAKMGTIAIGQCIEKKINFELISAISARGKLKINTRKYGKGKSKLAVSDYLKEIGIVVDDEDISDAIILALLSICDGMDYNPKTKKKKSSRKKK